MKTRAMLAAALVSAVMIAGTARAQEPVTRELTTAEKSALMTDIKDELRDPDSARFRWLPKIEGDDAYCGFVNSKNGYGGYAGFVPFYGIATTFSSGRVMGRVVQVAPHDKRSPAAGVAESMCAEAGYDLSQPGTE